MDTLKRPEGPHGWVAIQDGTIEVGDPLSAGQPAVIEADDSVLVYINDQLISEPVNVFSRTDIRIQLPFRVLPEYECDFKVTPDHLQVYLTVTPRQPGSFFKLPDISPTFHLMLRAQAEAAPLCAFAEDIRAHILAELQSQGICEGIQPEAIQRAIVQPNQTHLIAVGRRPQPAQNQLHFAFRLPEPDPLLPQGFALRFPVLRKCKAGEVLVQRERLSGQSGLSVYGQVLAFDTAPQVLLRAADGSVRISADQDQAIARIEGSPSFTGHAAKVGPFDSRSEDLPGGPGALYDISGTLQVQGGIQEQTRLWTTQHLELAGGISHAQVEVGEHAVIHGSIVRSRLTVGGDRAACMRLLMPVSQLHRQLEQVLQILYEIQRTVPSERQPDQKTLIIRIIKTQFPGLMKEVDLLWELNQSLKQLHPRRTMVLKVVMSHLLNLAERQLTASIFVDWLDKLRAFLNDLQAQTPMGSHIYFHSAQGADLTSSGHIFVLGEGCYHSQLQALGDIVFCGTPGYCRESVLKLGGRLIVPELGSPNGTRLKVYLGPQSEVRVQKLYPGVELHFGEGFQTHVLEPMVQQRIFWAEGQIHWAAL